MTDEAVVDIIKTMLKERSELMGLIKDLTDKIYFANKQGDLVAKKATEMPVDNTEKEEQEETWQPLEDVDPSEVAKSFRK